jgi:hypothetical protein
LAILKILELNGRWQQTWVPTQATSWISMENLQQEKFKIFCRTEYIQIPQKLRS